MSYIPIMYQSALEDIQYSQDKYSKQNLPRIIKDKDHYQILHWENFTQSHNCDNYYY